MGKIEDPTPTLQGLRNKDERILGSILGSPSSGRLRGGLTRSASSQLLVWSPWFSAWGNPRSVVKVRKVYRTYPQRPNPSTGAR